MQAEQSLREGKLRESLAQLEDQVRKDPSNAKYRVFLFQLLVLTGEWERALTQLGVVSEIDASTLAMVQTYREAVRCEVLRSDIFAGGRAPLIFGEPEPWVALMTEALRLRAEGRQPEAQRAREQAFKDAPATPGTINEVPFEWIADADSRLGPILEAIVNGHYYWIPFHRIRKITLEEPEDLRDMVWAAAEFTWANGGQTVGLIPTRYPGSHESDDELIRLSRKTEWSEEAEGAFVGSGQRMLATAAGEYSLLDIRSVTLDTAVDAADEA